MELILGYYLLFLISSNLYLFFCLILFWSKACIWYSYLILTAEADYLEQGIGVTTPRKREKKLPVFPGFTFYRSPTLVRSWNSYWFTIDVRLVNSLCSTLIYLYICWSLGKKHWTHKFILNVNKLALFELSVLNSTWKGGQGSIYSQSTWYLLQVLIPVKWTCLESRNLHYGVWNWEHTWLCESVTRQ